MCVMHAGMADITRSPEHPEGPPRTSPSMSNRRAAVDLIADQVLEAPVRAATCHPDHAREVLAAASPFGIPAFFNALRAKRLWLRRHEGRSFRSWLRRSWRRRCLPWLVCHREDSISVSRRLRG